MLADICVLAVVVFFIYSGYRAGLMRSFIRIASYIISIVISFFLYPVVSELLMKTALYDKLAEFIGAKYVMNSLVDASGGNTLGILSKYIGNGIEAAAGGIANSIAGLLINLIAFIIILILSKVIIRVVGNILGIFTRLPIIKQFNRLGGGILGGAMGILILYIICAVMLLFAPLDPQSKVAVEIEKSVFASEIYENNVILNFIGKGTE